MLVACTVPTLGQSVHSKYQDQETRATAYTDSTPTYLEHKTVLGHFTYGTTDNGYRYHILYNLCCHLHTSKENCGSGMIPVKAVFVSHLCIIRIRVRTYQTSKPVLWIRDILVRIRTLSYRYGSGSCSFRQWLSRCHQKISLLQSSKIKSHKELLYKTIPVVIKVFLTFLLATGNGSGSIYGTAQNYR